MTYLYLVRHGETDWNRARKIQGKTDIPLNDTGRTQAWEAGKLLSRRRWHGIVTSPLVRAAETARIIAEELGMPAPDPLDAIVERNYGEAEGLTGDELRARFPEGAEVPGRETREAVTDRVLPALIELAEQNPGRSLVVVSHGGVIRSLMHAVGPDHGPHHTEAITNGSIHSFRYIGEALELIAFDDAIESESVRAGADDFPEQNPIERREQQ